MVFVRFFGEVRKTKIAFEIIWPLVLDGDNVPPLVEIGLTDCQKLGGGLTPRPQPPRLRQPCTTATVQRTVLLTFHGSGKGHLRERIFLQKQYSFINYWWIKWVWETHSEESSGQKQYFCKRYMQEFVHTILIMYPTQLSYGITVQNTPISDLKRTYCFYFLNDQLYQT